MKKFLEKLVKPLHSLTKKRRAKYYQTLSNRLTNKTPTILSNDCLGGVIYHNLGLRFLTPTINTGLFGKDFIIFLKDIHGYLNAPLMENKDSGSKYPMGELTYNNTRILLHFVHDKTFLDAKENWEKRKDRIDFNNTYVIWNIGNELTLENLKEFDQLPYKNKLVIADKKFPGYDYVVPHPVYKKYATSSGKILHFTSRFSKKRHIDKIDYVSFLNQPS